MRGSRKTPDGETAGWKPPFRIRVRGSRRPTPPTHGVLPWTLVIWTLLTSPLAASSIPMAGGDAIRGALLFERFRHAVAVNEREVARGRWPSRLLGLTAASGTAAEQLVLVDLLERLGVPAAAERQLDSCEAACRKAGPACYVLWLHLKARRYMAAGAAAAAARLYERSLRLSRLVHPPWWLLRTLQAEHAAAVLASGGFEEALRILGRLDDEDDGGADAGLRLRVLRLRKEALLAAGRVEEALSLERFYDASLLPGSSPSWSDDAARCMFLDAVCLLLLGRCGEAAKLLEKAVRTSGRTLSNVSILVQARTLAPYAERLRGTEPWRAFWLAELFPSLEPPVVSDDRWPPSSLLHLEARRLLWKLAGDRHAREGDDAGAAESPFLRSFRRRAGETAVDDPLVAYCLAVALLDACTSGAERNDEAAARAERLLLLSRRLAPDDMLPPIALGRLYDASGRMREADRVYLSLLVFPVPPPSLYGRIATALEREDRAGEARKWRMMAGVLSRLGSRGERRADGEDSRMRTELQRGTQAGGRGGHSEGHDFRAGGEPARQGDGCRSQQERHHDSG